MTKTTPPVPTAIIAVPLSQLAACPLNVRKAEANPSDSIEELAASILAHGLLQNLIVAKAGDGAAPEGKPTYEVVAGNRRHAALLALAKANRISRNFLVPVQVVRRDASTELSLAENVVREPMHPVDEFEAFRALLDAGRGVEEIAARFGVSALAVRQRLRLANVSPRLLSLCRQDQISLDQLTALAVTDDHAEQERVWSAASCDWQREPARLRAALTEAKVNADTDPRAIFVGVEAYAAAGGTVERDLFQRDHAGYLSDAGLLDRLVAEKLEVRVQEIVAEGWKWCEQRAQFGYNGLSEFARVYPEAEELPEQARAEVERLEAEQEELCARHDHDPENYPLDVVERLEAIEARLEELNELAQERFRPEEMALAGAVVWLNHEGEAVVTRGLVRPEDKKAIKALLSGPESGLQNPAEGRDKDEPQTGLSAALAEELTAHRTAALRAALAARPDIALVAIAHHLALRAFYGDRLYEVPSALAISPDPEARALETHAQDVKESRAQQCLDQTHGQWRTRLPRNRDRLWKWLLKQEQAVVLELLAYCVSQTVYAVLRPHGPPTSARLSAAAQLAKALDFEMADWWEPTADNYLGRIKKSQVLAALQEAGKADDLPELATLKKGSLAALAQERLAGTRWVPELLKS